MLTLLACSAALGCSVGSEPFTADADSGTTHALVTIERSTAVGALGAPRADALVGFVRVPPIADPAQVLTLVGLGLDIPAAGQCVDKLRSRDRSMPLAPLGKLEFLEAGDVALSAGSTETTLAPRAFPTVTDLVSGVVYTTRDRSADPLPAAVGYQVRTSGGQAVPALIVQGQAPQPLDGLTLGGVPLAEIATVSTARPLDFAWTPGAVSDLVYVELASDDGATRSICTFRDEAGVGTVPPEAFSAAGAGRIAVHRVRSREFTSAGVDGGELRFDFELVTNATFSE